MNKRRQNIVGRFLAKFSLGLLILVLAGWWVLYRTAMRPVASKGELQKFEVSKGESVAGIADNLQKAGLIRSPLYFRYLVKVNKLTLQAGVYQFTAAAPPMYIAQALTNGRNEEVKLTIPEGYRVEQIAEAAGFELNEFRIAAKYMEGQMFPDTYFVEPDITPAELVEVMNKNLFKKVGETNTRTLILASLIERETKHKEEKPIVAGIIEKRLKAGWPLELDATIQYWLGKPGDWWPNTTLADRRIKSAYNTYLNLGLPPNPICNPGLEAINAARNPADSPYWFYLHDSLGNIHYATTLAEHNLNIDKYIR